MIIPVKELLPAATPTQASVLRQYAMLKPAERAEIDARAAVAARKLFSKTLGGLTAAEAKLVLVATGRGYFCSTSAECHEISRPKSYRAATP